MASYEILCTPPARTEFSDDVYSVIGRTLAVASRFEVSCKALALLLGICKQYPASGDFSLTRPEDLEALIAEISKRQLFQQIKSLVAGLRLPEEAKRLLHAARDDRNFIAHELTLGIDRLLESDQHVWTLKADLAVRVERVAMADLAVCLLLLL